MPGPQRSGDSRWLTRPGSCASSSGRTTSCMREGIVRLLAEAGLEVVAQAGDADDLLRKALAHRPDIAIVDVQMPPRGGDDGLVAAIELRRRSPSIGVLVLSQFYEESLRAGSHRRQRRGRGLPPEGAGRRRRRRSSARSSAWPPGEPPWTPRSSSGCSAGTGATTRSAISRPASWPSSRRWPKGKSNSGVAEALVDQRGGRREARHRIFRKLDIGREQTEHRRVRAVLTYVRSAGTRVS